MLTPQYLHQNKQDKPQSAVEANYVHDCLWGVVSHQPPRQPLEEEPGYSRPNCHEGEDNAGEGDVAVGPGQPSGPDGGAEDVEEAGEGPQVDFALGAQDAEADHKGDDSRILK